VHSFRLTDEFWLYKAHRGGLDVLLIEN